MKRYSNLFLELTKYLRSENISACLSCRMCVARCPISKITADFNPFRLIQMIRLGFVEEVLTNSSVWLCAACISCDEVCPNGIKISEFMSVLKTLAARNGYAPRGARTQVELLRENGRIYEIDDFDNKKREKLNLPSLPLSCDVVKILLSEDS